MIIGGSGAAVSSTTSLASVKIPSRFLVKARIFSSYVVAGPFEYNGNYFIANGNDNKDLLRNSILVNVAVGLLIVLVFSPSQFSRQRSSLMLRR